MKRWWQLEKHTQKTPTGNALSYVRHGVDELSRRCPGIRFLALCEGSAGFALVDLCSHMLGSGIVDRVWSEAWLRSYVDVFSADR